MVTGASLGRQWFRGQGAVRYSLLVLSDRLDPGGHSSRVENGETHRAANSWRHVESEATTAWPDMPCLTSLDVTSTSHCQYRIVQTAQRPSLELVGQILKYT